MSILFLWSMFHGEALAQRNVRAYPDFAQAISGTTMSLPVIIDVLANDYLGSANCTESNIDLQITVPPDASKGTAVVINQKVKFTPKENFKGMVSFTYRIACMDAGTNDAWVSVNVATIPDNIIEPTCYEFTQETVWGIEDVAMNETLIHNLMSPVAGDIDGDGMVEIIVAQQATGSDYWNNEYPPDNVNYPYVYPTEGLHIFYFNPETQSLAEKKKIDFELPYTVSTAVPSAIARYNNQGYIIVRTLNDLKLRAYSPTGTLL